MQPANSPHTVVASLLAFACILVVLALLLCIPFLLARLRGAHPSVDRLMDSAAGWMGAAPPSPRKDGKEPATKNFLRSLKVTKYTAPAADVEAASSSAAEDCCAICCCEYEQGQPVILLKCSHLFHRDCIAAWLKVDAVCPICKTKLLPQRNVAPDCRCSQQGEAAGGQRQPAGAAAEAAPAQAQSSAAAAAPASAAPPPAVRTAGMPALQVRTQLNTPMLGVAGVSP